VPITIKHDGQDTLADVLKNPDAQAYNPNFAQEAVNRQNSMRLHGAAHPDAEAPALMFTTFPDNDSDLKGWTEATNKMLDLQPEIKPYVAAISEKYARIKQEIPGISNTQAVEFAVCFIRKEKGLPLHGEKPTQDIHLVQNAADDRDPKAVDAHVDFLESQQAGTKYMRNNPDIAYRGDVAQYLAHAPKGKRK
jgi:hypothetical protein